MLYQLQKYFGKNLFGFLSLGFPFGPGVFFGDDLRPQIKTHQHLIDCLDFNFKDIGEKWTPTHRTKWLSLTGVLILSY